MKTKMTMREQIAKFKEETGIGLEITDGKPYYNHNLNLIGTKITSLPDNLTVGGYLDLQNTQITSLPDNLIVRDWIDLQKTSITSLPDNLIVGSSLYLQGTQITSLPDNFIVGGDIYLEGTPIEGYDKSKVNHNVLGMLSWHNGEYIKCDGIFSKVIEHKGNVWKVQELWSRDIYFLVTDGNGKYAHGETIQDAKIDLLYKISNRDTSVYDGLTLDSEVTFEQAIEMYRVITGACSAGTRNFVEHRLKVKKDTYTVSELIELTKGEYRAEKFAEFFNKAVQQHRMSTKILPVQYLFVENVVPLHLK